MHQEAKQSDQQAHLCQTIEILELVRDSELTLAE